VRVSTQSLCALMKTFRANKQKVIDRYSQVIYTARSVMPFIIHERTKFFTTRYCAGKGGIVDGD
jgi:hypothetical protein